MDVAVPEPRDQVAARAIDGFGIRGGDVGGNLCDHPVADQHGLARGEVTRRDIDNGHVGEESLGRGPSGAKQQDAGGRKGPEDGAPHLSDTLITSLPATRPASTPGPSR